MALTSMTANHVAAGQGQFEMQRASNALLYIVGLNSSVSGAGQGTGIKDDVLTLSLSTFALPKVTMTPVEHGYLNEKRKFVGRPTFDDLPVVFNDYVDSGTAALLQKWWYLCYNPENGFMGLAAQYKKAGMIRLNGPNGQFDREYELIGCFPSQFDMGDIDMMSEEGVKITMTLSYDKYIPRTGLNPSGNQ